MNILRVSKNDVLNSLGRCRHFQIDVMRLRSFLMALSTSLWRVSAKRLEARHEATTLPVI